MKILYIIRHAKSSWDNPDLSDFDRPLNDRGKKDAPRMGKRLKERRVTPDIMLSSPAARALATCQEIAKVLGFSENKIKTDRRLYHANEDQILKVVQELKDSPRDSEEIVMIFGHNPGLTAFANALLNEELENIPTCGVIAATLNIDEWKNARFDCGEMEFFDYPKRRWT
ncbi:MAG: histidine phosphatase family protein [Cyclobacteriaceae bacterium]|jgi:phosphohistidine phosphatase|nr:histidine phosphatase family protein [Cyclobacteriaceae bacterium]